MIDQTCPASAAEDDHHISIGLRGLRVKVRNERTRLKLEYVLLNAHCLNTGFQHIVGARLVALSRYSLDLVEKATQGSAQDVVTE